MDKKGGNTLSKSPKKGFLVNEGSFDRILRFLLGEFLVTFAYFWMPMSYPSIALFILGTLLMITGLTGYCLIYYFIGFQTVKLKKQPNQTLILLLGFYVVIIPVLVVSLYKFVSLIGQ